MHRLTSAPKSIANIPGRLRLAPALMLPWFSIMVACGHVEYESPDPHQHQDSPESTQSADPTESAESVNETTQDPSTHPSAHESSSDAHHFSQIRTYTAPQNNRSMSSAAWEESLVTAYSCDFSRKIVKEFAAHHYSAATNGIAFQEDFTNEVIELLLLELDRNKALFHQTSVNYLLDKYSSQLLTDFIHKQSCEQLQLLKADIEALAGPQLAYMLNLLFQDHDFSKKEYVNTQGVGPQLTWPTHHNLAERQRKIAKFSFINHLTELENHDADIYSAKAKFYVSSLYKSNKHHLIYSSNERFYFEFSKAVMQALDHHSQLFTFYDGRRFNNEVNDSYTGLGISLEVENKYVKIKTITPNGAVYLDGRIKVGDYIAAIKPGELNSDAPWISTQDISVRQFINTALGEPNTPISLRILTPIGDDSARRRSYELTLIRKQFTQQAYLNADGAYHIYQIDDPGLAGPVNVGYVIQQTFSPKSTQLIYDAIHDLIDQGADVILFDYRNNGGGLLDAGINILNYFVKSPIGTWISNIRTEKDGYPIPPELKIERRVGPHRDVAPEVYDIPLIFMINNKSASSVEVITSSIKSHGRALIIGDERSFGKGTVQAIGALSPPNQTTSPATAADLEPVGVIKLTTGKYYPPDGISIQIKGVASDVVIPSYSSKLSGYPIDHPFYRFHLQSEDITEHINLDHLLHLGFRDDSLIHKLSAIYEQRTKSEAYLAKNQSWINEDASPFNEKTPIYLDAKNDSITRQLYTAEFEARRAFLLEQPAESRKAAAIELLAKDYMLDEALFIAAHYYELCRLNQDGSTPTAEYDKSAGCFKPAPIEAEVTTPADEADDT